MLWRFALIVALGGLSSACSKHSAAPAAERGVSRPEGKDRWSRVFAEPFESALISVWGRGPDDVWTVGSASGDSGALLMHYDGSGWRRHALGLDVDLWWVNGVGDDGPIFFGGSSGTLLRYMGGAFTRLSPPNMRGTIYGVWAAAADDVWAVGGDPNRSDGAFVWRYDGSAVRAVSLPDGVAPSVLYKVWGTAPEDVWIVGTDSTLLHYDGSGFVRLDTGAPDPLFTIHARAGATPRAIAVGGFDLAAAFEIEGDSTLERAALPAGTRQLFGVWIGEAGTYTVGADAAVYRRTPDAWEAVDTGLDLHKALHAVWVDPSGGVWAVGGDVLVPPLGQGVMVHYGRGISDDVEIVDTPLERPDAGPGPDSAPKRDAGPKPPADAGPEAGGATPGDGGTSAVDSGPPPPPREPGRILCGGATCDASSEQCCLPYDESQAAACASRANGCPSGYFNVDCDEPGDCAPGESCCLYRFLQGGGIAEISCGAACAGQVVCLGDGDCGSNVPCTSTVDLPDYPLCQ